MGAEQVEEWLEKTSKRLERERETQLDLKTVYEFECKKYAQYQLRLAKI